MIFVLPCDFCFQWQPRYCFRIYAFGGRLDMPTTPYLATVICNHRFGGHRDLFGFLFQVFASQYDFYKQVYVNVWLKKGLMFSL